MTSGQIYIVILVLVLAIIAILVFVVNKNKQEQKFTPLAGLGFGFILAGLFFGDKRLIGYSLIGIGVILAIVDMIKKKAAKGE